MGQVRENICRINIGGAVINNLIDEDISALQGQLELTTTAAEQCGLIPNTNKTQTMVFRARNIESRIQVVGGTIENVEKIEYLGSLITWGNNCADGIKGE